MLTPLESALAEIQRDIDTYQMGTPQQPLPGSFDYYLLRAQLVGQAYLLRLKNLDLEADIAASERMFRKGTVHFGHAGVPPVEKGSIEKVPDDVILPRGVPRGPNA